MQNGCDSTRIMKYQNSHMVKPAVIVKTVHSQQCGRCQIHILHDAWLTTTDFLLPSELFKCERQNSFPGLTPNPRIIMWKTKLKKCRYREYRNKKRSCHCATPALNNTERRMENGSIYLRNISTSLWDNVEKSWLSSFHFSSVSMTMLETF